MDSKKLIGQALGKQQYILQKRLGAGAFGEIFLCINKQNQQEYAMKLESSDTQFPQIQFEAKLYSYLNSDQNNQSFGVAKFHYFGQEQGFNFMVIDKLGYSLENIFNLQRKKFSIKTVCMLGEQMIQRIEFLHSKSFLHRDIKPDNFLMGVGKRENQVYIIDFGLSKRYISNKDGCHIPYRSGKSLTGTARYASVNTHLGIEQSRRDDLESIGYVIIYFLRGILPWQNQQANNKNEKYKKIMEKKMQTSTELLCKGLPPEFSRYLNYCKNLKFEDKPDYNYLRSLLKEVLETFKLEYDYNYDWTVNPPEVYKKSILNREISQEDIQLQHDLANENRLSLYPLEPLQQSNFYQKNSFQKNKQFLGKQITTNQQHNCSYDNQNFISYDNTPEKPKMNPPNFDANFTINHQNYQNTNNFRNATQNSFLVNINKSGVQNFGNVIDSHYNNLMKSQHNNMNNASSNNQHRSVPLPKIVQHKNTKNFQ